MRKAIKCSGNEILNMPLKILTTITFIQDFAKVVLLCFYFFYRIITSDEYGKNTQMPNGKMDNRLTTLEETLDSVSESVIDKLIPAVIKMQKDVKVYIIN